MTANNPPNPALYWQTLLDRLIRKENSGNACVAIIQSIPPEIYQQSPILQFQHATALIQAGRYAEALPVLTRLEGRPEIEGEILYLALGDCHIKLNHKDEATACDHKLQRVRQELASDFRLSPDLITQDVLLVDGNRGLVVDNFFAEPEKVCAYAIRHANSFRIKSSNSYPGPEFAIPPELTEDIFRWWRNRGRWTTGLSRTLTIKRARFSITTLAPQYLGLHQRFCHVDMPPDDMSSDSQLVAGVIYLFNNEELGGTSFFKIRPGIDLKDIRRRYKTGEQKELTEKYEFFRLPPSYPIESNDLFELKCTLPAHYNRAIFYRSNIYHSPDIRHPEKLSPNLAQGRLTINLFMCGVPNSYFSGTT